MLVMRMVMSMVFYKMQKPAHSFHPDNKYKMQKPAHSFHPDNKYTTIFFGVGTEDNCN